MESAKHAMLSAIVDSSDDAIISKDLNGIIKSWNAGAERIFGFSEQEAVGRSITLIIPDERLDEERLIIGKIRTGERVDHFETVRRHKNGTNVPISLTVSPIRNASGVIVGASKVARDITDSIQADTRQAILSAIVESSDDAIISKDLNGIITSWNHGAQQIFGYTEQEMIGKSITLLIPEDRLNEEDIIISNIKNGKRIDHFETFRKDKQGREIPVSVTISPIRDRTGKIIGASKVGRNISDQLQTQADLKKHMRNLEILNSIGKSIAEKMDFKSILQTVTDATTKITGAAFGAFFYNTVNQRDEAFTLYTLSGAPKEAFEKFGMPRNTAIFHPTFSGQSVVRLDDVTQDPRYGHNSPHQGMPKGHLPVVSYLAVPVISTSGEVIGGLFFGHPKAGVFQPEHEDLVVNIAAQAAIALDNSRLFEQVKSLSDKKDEFIALASHELKTPMTTIKGYLQVLAKGEHDQRSRLFLEKSLYQVEKLNSLVEDLLDMSRAEAGKLEFNLEDFDLRQLLTEQAEAFRYTTKTHQLLTEFSDVPVIVNGDRQRIEQAVINLLSNAVKYSPGAHEVVLKLTAENGQAIIRVKDYGVGLTPDQQPQVFTRFYRAEGMKGISGLGLGLYLTKQVIDRHNGTIKVTSEAGKGSEFIVTLNLKTD
jgi:PAS domain S-box-containing protein